MEFFDTNILVYAVDPSEPERCAIAGALLREALDKRSAVISTQVMFEFGAAVLRRKLMTAAHAAEFLRDFVGEHVVPAHPDFVLRVYESQQRLGFSIWDAAIVQAAVESKCDVLYTEDLQHGQRIDSLLVVNPFRATQVHEPRPVYKVREARRKA
jgi:predicted nucleic acid-binding protein